MIRLFAIFFAYLTMTSFVSAQVSLSLPTRGYCRIGKYVPMAITTPAAREIRVTGQGLLPLRIEAGNSPVSATFSLLVISRPGTSIDIAVDGVTHVVPAKLHLLSDDERLVAIDGMDPSLARKLFPGRSIVTASIDESQFSAGDAMAWETLDGIVCANATPLPRELNAFQTLLAGGVTLAIRGDQAPTAAWPWKKNGVMWTLQRDPLGFTSSIDARAYEPVMNWRPGAPSATRVRVMGIGVLVAIAFLAASLLRGRKRIVVIVIIAIASAVVAYIWAAMQPRARRVFSEIVASDAHWQQSDDWSYVTADRDVSAAIDIRPGLTKPMLFSADQAARLNLTLVCNASGRPLSFQMRLPAETKFAVMSRTIDPPTPIKVLSAATDSPMQTLASDVYAVDGYKIIGQSPRSRDEQWWPAVFLQRAKR